MIRIRCLAVTPLIIALLLGVGVELSAGGTAAIRAAIERSGGVLRTDDQGQPSEIDLTVGRASADAVSLEAALACPTLKRLRIRAGRMPSQQLVRIGSLAGLDELTLQDALLDDQGLTILAERLRGLRRLTLRNAFKISDRGIAGLAQRSQLTHLSLIEMQITDQAIPAVAAMPSLLSLDLRMCERITASGLRSLVGAPKLKELKVGGQGMDDAAVAVVATLQGLESLAIEDSSLGPVGLASLTETPAAVLRWRVLALARCLRLDDEALKELAAWSNLRRLSVRDMPVTGEFLQALPAPEQLELLSLNQTFLADEAFEAIAACRHLKRLELAQNPLSLKALQTIGTLSELEYLNLAECAINDESLAPLAKLQKLKTLIVEGNPEISHNALDALGLRN